MQRWFLAGCSAFLLTVVASTGRGDDAALRAKGEAVSPYARLISLLSDPDPAVRLDSRERLIDQGEPPRPELRKALATADPQTRSEINRILLHIRWTGFGDSDRIVREPVQCRACVHQTHALEIQPDNIYMQRQVKRFRGAAVKP